MLERHGRSRDEVSDELAQDGRRPPAVNARGEVVPGPAPELVEPSELPLVFEGEATELEPSTKPASRQPWRAVSVASERTWRTARIPRSDVLSAEALFDSLTRPGDTCVDRIWTETGPLRGHPPKTGG